MTADRTNYYLEALSDAWATLDNFADEMVEQFATDGEVSNDLNNDYDNGDEYHHLTHVDKAYTLTEAAAVLDQLSDYEETDNGLWEGLDPREAISAQAAYTYGNCVYAKWSELVDDLNGHLDSLADSLPADAPEELLHAAGEALIRFYVWAEDPEETDENREELRFRASAFDNLKGGDYTAALALADYYQDRGDENRGRRVRELVKSLTEYVPEEADDAQADDE
jgi:hypothetical protein